MRVLQQEKKDALSGAVHEDHGIHHSLGDTQFWLDPIKRLVVVRFGKKLTARDIERYAAFLKSNPFFQADFSEVADITAVEQLDLSAEEFIRLADVVDPFSEKAKRAFVVSNEVQSHAARMHKILRTQRSFSVFRTIELARKWLDA